MLDRTKVSEAVIKVLEEIQEMSGRSLSSIGGTTCPMGDLEGFDSLNAVEATALVSERLGCSLPANVMLPRPGQMLSVSDIVDRITSGD
jgi:acyl carrier protein